MSANQQPTLFDLTPDPWQVDAAMDGLVARIVFAQGAEGIFDYRVPDALRTSMQTGKRVRVPWGRTNRFVEGYCVGISSAPVHDGRLKNVESVLDAQPIASPSMLQLTQWMSEHYLTAWGRVLEAVIPAGVRHQAGTREVILLSVASDWSSSEEAKKLPSKQAAILQVASDNSPLTQKQLCLAAKCTSGPIQALRRKGLLITTKERVQSTWDQESPEPESAAHELNASQQAALETIERGLGGDSHEVYLLHGVTGSGKTEVYMRAIEQVIAAGRQAIVLVPEISLTPQTCRRFRARFRTIAVLHSHLSDSERHWHWQQISSGSIHVVVGARSAVFAPTPRLGLIVIDEEHDASFKQDSVPRYHARDVALQRAALEKFPVILGSATPSLESWHHARTQTFHLIKMGVRIRDLPLPPVDIVDLRTMAFDKKRRGSISRPLEQQMRQALKDKGQVILLLNRRGYSTHIQCPACGMVLRCPECDIALTHHRDLEQALCHYCDFHRPAPPRCPDCQFEGIRYSGSGTQKLEAEVQARFPSSRCLRMDSDSMKRHGSHELALTKFRNGEVDILLGTQMIAKGLDFPNVTLVGVINADSALHLPDFRAAERTFQLITQVAGRTGRGDRGGRVVVQTCQPDHPAVQAAARHDYEQFAAGELPQREPQGYPPFGHMVRIIVRGPDEKNALQYADSWMESLRKGALARPAGIRVLGPAPAPIARLRGLFRFHALVQGPDADQLRQLIRDSVGQVKLPTDVQSVIDVDPTDML
ncbi:MAG: primosomal protein N' [Planctomycetota bacterium]|nr:primosomal protein N' [Planctomycetota bacterium]